MSSVSSSDSSPSNDPVRKAREANVSSEAEVAKKHQREIRKLTEQHYAEVEGLKQAHSEQLDQLRKNSHDEVNARDHKYQQEIEDLRGLYRKQVQGQSEDGQRREEAVRSALTGDSEKQKKTAEVRVQALGEDYKNGLQTIQKSSENTIKLAREAQQLAIDTSHDRIVKKYDEEGKTNRDQNENRYASVQKSFEDYRHNAAGRIQDMEIKHLANQQGTSNANMRTVQKERQIAVDQLDRLSEGYTANIEKNRDDFAQASISQRDASEEARRDLEAKLSGQIDDKVTRLEHENFDLKDGSGRDAIQVRQRQQRELANIATAYQKNMDNYKDQRDAAVRASNDRVHKSVEGVRRDMSKQLVNTNRDARIHEEEQSQIHRLAYGRIKGDFDTRNEQVEAKAEQRVKNLLDHTVDEQQRTIQLHEDTQLISQRAHKDEMRQLRANLEDDKQLVVINLQERLQKQEIQHGEKLSQVVAKYEKQIQALQDQVLKDKKSSDDNLKRTAEEMMRTHKITLEQVDSQNRARLKQVEAKRQEEVSLLNKRNDEKIEQVITNIKKS